MVRESGIRTDSCGTVNVFVLDFFCTFTDIFPRNYFYKKNVFLFF